METDAAYSFRARLNDTVHVVSTGSRIGYLVLGCTGRSVDRAVPTNEVADCAGCQRRFRGDADALGVAL
jgi:hypothetical protein